MPIRFSYSHPALIHKRKIVLGTFLVYAIIFFPHRTMWMYIPSNPWNPSIIISGTHLAQFSSIFSHKRTSKISYPIVNWWGVTTKFFRYSFELYIRKFSTGGVWMSNLRIIFPLINAISFRIIVWSEEKQKKIRTF